MATRPDRSNEIRERLAMTYDFEDVVKRLIAKRNAANERSEEENMERLQQILDRPVDKCSIRIAGNASLDAAFIAQELDIQTPNSVGGCSDRVFNGLSKMDAELDLFKSIGADIDLDPDDPRHMIVDLSLKEKSKLTASIGVSHDTQLSSMNSMMSMGIRNIFGRGERLDVTADMGMASSNEFDLRTAVYKVSNQYAVSITKPRLVLPYYFDPFTWYHTLQNKMNGDESVDMDRYQRLRELGTKYKYNLNVNFFNQKLDRSRMSSYSEDSIGVSTVLQSPNKLHSVSHNYIMRSLTPVPMTSSGMVSGSIADEQMPSLKHSIAYAFAKDTRNHLAVPSDGYLASLTAELAGLPSSDSDFFKMFGSFQRHFSLLPYANAILNVGFGAGFVVPWKRRFSQFVSERLGNASLDDSGKISVSRGDRCVRLLDRFVPYAGLRCRGFDTGHIGPKDGSDYVHCDALASFGLSVTFPLMEWLYAHCFFNAVYTDLIYSFTQARRQEGYRSNLGNATNQQHSSSVSSVGASLVVPFPIGRMEIGYAYPFFFGAANRQNQRYSSVFWNFDVNFY